MRQFVFSTALGLIFIPDFALADCVGETFISCDIDNGRYLEVCIEPGENPGEGAFTYRFGTQGEAELMLREDFAAGTVTPWSGVGRAIWGSVAFRNDGYLYEVWHSFDRLEENSSLEGGVNILQGMDVLASLSCEPGSETKIAPMFSLEDAMTEAGYCLERHEWQRDGCG